MLPHCLLTFLLMKQLRSSEIKSLPTACFSKVLIAQFIKLLYLAVQKCHFTFNNRIYQQIDGVVMSNPSWLHNCPFVFNPLLYRRYVDDCFLFKSLNHVPLFLDYVNRQHPNIFFTSKLEKDGKFPFLDVKIFRSIYPKIFRLS